MLHGMMFVINRPLTQDEKVKLLFQRIATLRKQWKDLEQWDEHTPDGNDDDRFEAAEQSPRNQCPDGTPASTVADSQVSSFWWIRPRLCRDGCAAAAGDVGRAPCIFQRGPEASLVFFAIRDRKLQRQRVKP